MDVIVTGNRGKERTYMKTFTIDEQNNITAFGTQEEAAATTTTPFDSFASEQELAELAKAWPPERFVAVWNSIPGVKPVKNVKNAEGAAGRIWERIQTLGETAELKAKGGAHAAKGASSKAKAAKAQGDAGPREGSKTAQVVAMLQRKNGATLAEIVDKMGWQKHTVRGFMAGAMKKAGYTVESLKSHKGERTYRINQ